eukprot:3230917-Prorocentrum_lima.AAC.1
MDYIPEYLRELEKGWHELFDGDTMFLPQIVYYCHRPGCIATQQTHPVCSSHSVTSLLSHSHPTSH